MQDLSGFSLRCRPLQTEDLAAATAIAATAPDPWRQEDLAAAIADTTRDCLASFHNGELVGFACFRRVDEETSELEMLAVREDKRRLREPTKVGTSRGVGESLVRFGLYYLLKSGARRCLLEVRTGNTAAIGLYKKVGFKVLATRPNLYSHPLEDGLIMEYIFE